MVRIYPVYVLKESKLYEMYENGEYLPLELEDAVKRASLLYKECIKNKINVIRIGLQTTEEINSKNNDIKGPVCDNYKERVLSNIAKEEIIKKIKKAKQCKELNLIAKTNEINYIVGPNKNNIYTYESEYCGKIKVKSK